MLLGFQLLIRTQGGVRLAFKKAIHEKWLKREKVLSITRNNFSEINLFSVTVISRL